MYGNRYIMIIIGNIIGIYHIHLCIFVVVFLLFVCFVFCFLHMYVCMGICGAGGGGGVMFWWVLCMYRCVCSTHYMWSVKLL